ncbi:MAG TPA: CAP domain-containing protein, partial [Actinomycetota bacterium]|nr:CAP domain-containing protein [Actinomycetota bacterium]
ESAFAQKINDARRNHDRQPVQLDPQLSRVAQFHSWAMKEEARLFHTPEDKLRERVTRWEILGEAVGRGTEVGSLFQAFMDSPDHRDIFLYPKFNYVGVATTYDDGVMWVTILFEAFDDPGTTMDMPPTC